MYSLFWRSPALPYNQKQTAIVVPAGSVVSNASSLRFTGKGAANYGKIQQENQLRLLENFAGPDAPDYPTVGQTWYDTDEGALKVCIATAPSQVMWRAMNSTQITEVGENPPTPAVLGDTWFERTGSVSGIHYIYTGIGRYPEVDWDANLTGYFPDTSTTLTAKLNYQSFTVVNDGEAYICGVSAGLPADIPGSIIIDGTPTAVPTGSLPTNFPSVGGYVVWDTNPTGLFASAPGGTVFRSVRQLVDGTWQFDDNTVWVTFSPTGTMYVIGVLDVAEVDDNTPPGITSMTLWDTAKKLSETSHVQANVTDGAVGGWAQTFPAVDTHAGREEYAFMAGLVSQLIGDTSAFGGAGSIGRSINYLTPLSTLDASTQLAWSAATPHDQNVVHDQSMLNLLRTAVNSGDWDKLLAAAKYAVSRLELPVGMVSDISDLPFVYDGRQVPAVLLAKPPTDPQHPTDRRKTNPRLGAISLSRLYQETVNVLQAAISTRYTLKGIQGTSGVNTMFSPNVGVSAHVAFTADATGTPFAAAVTHGVAFNFSTDDVNLQRFFCSGQSIELVMRAQPSGSPTAADTNLTSLCATHGRFRITNDAVYVMDSSGTPGLTMVPGSIGFSSVGVASTVLASATVGTAALILRAQLMSANVVRVFVDVAAGGATTGQVFADWNLITDNETYGASVRVYPLPNAFAPTDKLGSALFV